MCIDNIEITDIIIFPIKGKKESNEKAYVKIILNDSLILSGIKILKGKNYFIRFPQDIKGIDITFPIKASLRNYISDQVLAQFELCRGAL